MKLSIIIPTLNDGKNVVRLVKQLQKKDTTHIEIIVVEAGDTRYFSQLRDVITLTSAKGRAYGLNAGIKKSRGHVLLFLHADSDAHNLDLEKLKLFPSFMWGNFQLKFRSLFFYFRFIEWTSANRACYGVVFGDQGLVIGRQLLEAVGLFSQKTGYEDIDMSLRLRKKSRNLVFNEIIYTSPRRFEKHGVIWTHFIMGLITIFYLLNLQTISKKLYKVIS